MKKGFILLGAAVAMVAILLFSGCFTVTDEEGTGPTEYWDAAYDFEHKVNTTLGTQGKVDKFTFEENIIRGEEKLTYKVDGTYGGVKDTKIHGFQYDYSTGNQTKVEVGTVACEIIEYKITRTKAENTDDEFPDWYKVKIYRVEDETNDATYYGIYGYWAKYESSDSEGNSYTWENPEAVQFGSNYTVYYEGTDNNYAHDDVIWHMYYSLWGGFWVNYGEGFRDGRKWGITVGTTGWSHTTDKTTYTVGSHVFNAWEAKSKWTGDGDSWVNKAIIATSCPIPLLFQWKVDADGEINSFEYKLTDISFK